jgi:hypothetical protein
MFLLRALKRLSRRRLESANPAESAPPQPAPPSEDEFDESWSRAMRKIDRPMRDLRGDGAKLDGLIKRIEATTHLGELAMRRRSST